MRSSTTDSGAASSTAREQVELALGLACAGGRARSSTIGSNTSSRPWRGWPSESKAPALISDSIVRLLSTVGSTRSQKS